MKPFFHYLQKDFILFSLSLIPNAVRILSLVYAAFSSSTWQAQTPVMLCADSEWSFDKIRQAAFSDTESLELETWGDASRR